MNKPIQRVWTFHSDSNPDLEYQTLKYTDGSVSCNCAGWTRRVAADGTRSCKHTRWVDLGTADRHCSATHDYGTTKERNYVEKQRQQTPKLGQRKFAV
ncbi:MAG: hypothetical protein ACK4UN_20570 [Limisphaerales bacterium]